MLKRTTSKTAQRAPRVLRCDSQLTPAALKLVAAMEAREARSAETAARRRKDREYARLLKKRAEGSAE